jgi:ATP-dependent Clp protease protease subunit
MMMDGGTRQANEIMHHKATLSAYIAEFTGQTLSQIIEDTDRDFFMSAADAKTYGLVDHVIATPKTPGADQVEMYPPYNLKY